mgnify:CR=1 FL=1
MQQTDYERRGYLHEDFRLFHLSSALAEDTAFHYHEFHKLVFFLAGRGNYIVEGRTHALRPYDVVLVRQGAIHKAQIDPSQRYERVILYISPEFLRTQSTADSSLDACFRLPADGQSFVLRPEAGRRAALLRTLDALEAEEQSTAYGHDLLARAQMLQLLVIYFGKYFVFGLPLTTEYRFWAVIIAFSLNYAAYFAEIFRSGIQSIPVGQYEAAKILGYSRFQTFLRIITPQMTKRVLPAVTNESITLVKDTSLAFAISYIELFTETQMIAASETSMLPYLAAAIFYYVFNLIVAGLMSLLEKRLNYYKI